MSYEDIIKRAIISEQKKYLLIGLGLISTIVAASIAVSIGLTPQTGNNNTIGFYQDLEVGDVMEFRVTNYQVDNGVRSTSNNYGIINNGTILQVMVDQELPDSANLETFNMSQYLSMKADGISVTHTDLGLIWKYIIAPKYITNEDGNTSMVAEEEWHLFIMDDLRDDTVTNIHAEDIRPSTKDSMRYHFNATNQWNAGANSSTVVFDGEVNIRFGYTHYFLEVVDFPTHSNVYGIELLSHISNGDQVDE